MATDWTQFTPVDESPVDKKKTDWSQFTPVEDSGALRGVADTGLSIGRGLATGTQMVADSFGANNKVSRGARKIAEGLGKLKSDQSQWETQAGAQRMDAAEASGSKLNEFVAGVKNFADQPFDMLAEGIGSSAPTLAAAALSKGRVNPIVTGAGMGGVQGAGAVKGQIHEDVKQRHIAAGLPEAEAEARAQAAQAYGGENADQIALGAGLGALAGTTGAESAVSRLIGHTGKGGLKSVATGAITEGATEFAQGGQERLAANVAAQREGFDADTWQGVVGQGTMEGLAGAGSGAAFGAVEAMSSRPEVKVDPNAGAISKALSQHPEVTPAAAPGALIQPPVAEPEVAIDPATTGQANYARVVNESAPMPLEKAQNIAFQMNAGGNGNFYVAPHGNAGFTVVPSSWLTDGQLAEFSSVQGEGGMLPPPVESGVLRVDAAGNAAPETLAQAEELAAIRQRLLNMGKPTPRGANPNDTIQKASGKAPAIAAGIPPQAVIETPGPRGIVETVQPRGIVETVPPRGIIETPGPRGIVETVQPNKSEDIAGDKIDRKWTAFDQASGTLGIDRAQMPQIKSEHRGAMVNFLNARGIASEQATVLPTDLKATQREFSPQKVEKAKGFTGNDRPILVSSDGHVLDGHHQWLAKRESGQPVKVIRLNAPIRELLAAVSEFPSAQTAAGATPRAVVENAPGPRGIVETVPPRALIETAQQGVAHGAADADLAAMAHPGGEMRGDNGVQGVPSALALPSGRGLGDPAAGAGAGGAANLPAGPADRNDAVIARVGTTPNSADPVTVRAGVVHVGEYPAQDFETGEDITVPEGATFEQVADALRQGRVLSSKQRIYAGAKGMRQAKAADAKADVPQPDRRVDAARRQAVAEMDVETLRRELLTDHLTGLGNRRAYDESTKLAAQVSIDADSLKWVNDNLGHDSGDKLLKSIGQALGEETANAYHVSGDEFIVQATTEAEAQEIMDRAVSRMAGARIEATDAAGRDIVLTGVGVSYGIAGDLREAEKRLGQHKADRETQGQRAARGEVPPNAAVGSGRGADQPGDAAAEAVEQDAAPDIKRSTNGYALTDNGYSIAPNEGGFGIRHTKIGYALHGADRKPLTFSTEREAIAHAETLERDIGPIQSARPDGWRTNAIKAGKVMKDLGIPRADGMKLADMVAAIDAHEAKPAKPRKPKVSALATKDPGKYGEAARRVFLQTIRQSGGVSINDASDITGETRVNSSRMSPGFFSAGAPGIDLVARRLHEAGYITDAEYNDTDGGVQVARDLINNALRKQPVLTAEQQERMAELLEIEAGAHAELQEQAEQDVLAAILGADLTDAEFASLHEGIALDDDLNQTDAVRARQQEQDDEQNRRIESEAGETQPGGAEARTQGGEGQPRRAEGFALAGQTPAELEAADRQAKQAAADKADAEAKAEARAKADRERGDFTLTGSDRAADANAGQADISGGMSQADSVRVSNDIEGLRRQIIEIEDRIIGQAGMARDFIEDAMKSRKVDAGLKAKRNEMRERLRELRNAAEKLAPSHPATEAPAWHTKFPESGKPITEQQAKNYQSIPNAISSEAYDAVRQDQFLAGGKWYAYLMQASGRNNGVVRFVPEDQNPPKPWKLVNPEGIRIGGMTREQVTAKVADWLRREPVLGDIDAPEAIANPAGAERKPEQGKVTPQVPPGDMEKYIKVAADSIETLRKVDVYRVLVESNRREFRLGIANYIKSKRPDLAAEVDSVLAEAGQETPANPAATITIFESLAQKSKRRKTIDSLESHPLKDTILAIDANFQKIAGQLEAAGFVTIDCGG